MQYITYLKSLLLLILGLFGSCEPDFRALKWQEVERGYKRSVTQFISTDQASQETECPMFTVGKSVLSEMKILYKSDFFPHMCLPSYWHHRDVLEFSEW